MAKTVKNLSEIKDLPIGTKLFEPTPTGVDWFYYFGINPRSKDSIILGSASNVNKIHGQYIGEKEIKPYYLDYDEACQACLKEAKENVKVIKEIYIKPKAK